MAPGAGRVLAAVGTQREVEARLGSGWAGPLFLLTGQATVTASVPQLCTTLVSMTWRLCPKGLAHHPASPSDYALWGKHPPTRPEQVPAMPPPAGRRLRRQAPGKRGLPSRDAWSSAELLEALSTGPSLPASRVAEWVWLWPVNFQKVLQVESSL